MKPMQVWIAGVLLITASGIQAKKIIVPKDVSTIQAGIEKTETGDTVQILNGIYNETLVLKDSISLIGETINKTILRGNSKNPVVTCGNNSLLKNCTITNGAPGILCENVSAIIEQVIVKDNKSSGIHCLIGLPDISNCIIYRNTWTGIFCESVKSIKTSIEHNVIAENGYCGIKLNGKSEVLIIHNVFFSNKELGIWSSDDSKKSRIIYNDFFGNRAPVNSFALTDKSNINEDPNYPVSGSDYDFVNSGSIILKGKGKDGATIGLISEEELKLNKNDSDGDGVLNDKDACPSIEEDIDNFQDQDGCPDFDNDNDGIYDSQDRCPDLAEDFDGYKDDDGCDDFDNDGDNIPDEKDICPNNAETVNNYKDDDGCPDEPPQK